MYKMSADTLLGVPYNIASYAALLLVLCKESGLKPGTLTGTFGDVHMYEHHREALTEQVSREPKPLPTAEIENWTNVWDWKAEDIKLIGYEAHPAITARVSV